MGIRRVELPIDIGDVVYLLVWKTRMLRTVSEYSVAKIKVTIRDGKEEDDDYEILSF